MSELTNPIQKAVQIKIIDSGDYYTGTEVETALQEIGDGTTLDTRYLKLDASNDPITDDLLIKPASDSATALEVQKSDGTQVLSIDTNLGRIRLKDQSGGASFVFLEHDPLSVGGVGLDTNYGTLYIGTSSTTIVYGKTGATSHEFSISGVKVMDLDTSGLVLGTSAFITSGGLAIGTSTLPEGGVGNAKLAIEGTNASTAGPHVQFTTASDDYPLMQILPYSHDNVQILFDAYWANGFKGSDAGSSFAIRKNSDKLEFRGAPGVTPGDPISFATTLTITTNPNRIGMGTLNPLARFDIVQGSTTAAVSVLRLEQKDISEEFIGFVIAGDTDMVLAKLSVTDNPIWGWDESEDAFYFDKGLIAGDGGTTNYAKFASDGELNLFGTARVIKHVQAIDELGKGGTAPTVRTTEEPYVSYTYAVNNDSHITFEIPEDMDFTVAATIKVHWYTSVNQTNDEVNWEVRWNARAPGETVNTGETIDTSGDVNCPTQWQILETTIETVPANSIAAGDVFGLHLERIAIVGGTNPAAGSIHVLSVELEYTCNKLGLAT